MKILRNSVILIIVFLVGYFLHPSLESAILRKDVLPTDKNCQYPFINQLRCEPDLARKKKEYTVLKNEIVDYIEKEKSAQHVSSVAVYFRDLQNGPIMGINGGENYAPASLLKLPLLIAFYKKAETDPQLLQHEITAPESVQALPQNIAPETSAQGGKKYKIDDLLNILIKESDNTSGQILLAYLSETYPQEDLVFTLSDLGIIDPRKSLDEQYVTAQSYSSIFRILYNSSYLNREMSNKALELLLQSEFKEGLVAGVPSGIKVAHKFGERKNGEEQQLHDCGIIYYELNPYMLCIMTKGKDVKQLERIISEISRNVYDEVDERN